MHAHFKTIGTGSHEQHTQTPDPIERVRVFRKQLGVTPQGYRRNSVKRASLCQESRARHLVEWWTILVTDRPPDRPPAISQTRRRPQAGRGCEEGLLLPEAGCS
jgi:hypothetical protein